MLTHNTISNPASTSIKLLIVNNDTDVLATINTSLRAAKLENLHSVDSAQQALRIMRQHPIDVLIVDVDTADLDGWRLSRLVRSGILRCRADLPIIIIASTWCERIAEVTAREYGINHLLSLDHLEQLPALVRQLAQNHDTGTPRPRLLVVEDDADTADLTMRVLGSTFEIETVGDGDSGLAAWVQRRHDLVLLDLMLPTLSGRDILIEIHRIDPTQPVVIMTAHTTIDQAEELMLLGAVDFLPKPFRAEQLRKVCEIAIHRDDFLVSNAQFTAQLKNLQEREQAYRQLYESHHQLLDDLQSVVMELDTEFTICYLNRAWESMMGFTIGQCIGQPLENFIAPEDLTQFSLFKNRIRTALQQHKPCPEIELCLNNKHHQKLWAQLKISRSSKHNQQSSLTICLDNVTERHESQEQLKYLAMHDSLTGLYNRHFFETTLAQLTADSARTKRQHALVYLDLDHFKVINDTFGHQKGDSLLREMSRLLRKRIRATDTLCRLGGDEFAILLRDIQSNEAHEFAHSIQKIISEVSVQLQEQRINLGSSIGLALIDGSTNNAEEYLMRADIALYVAKGRGRNLVHQYDPLDSESDQLRHTVNMSQKVRNAIADNRLMLYFQPIFDIKKNKISYYEALVRMTETDGRIIGPNTFIPSLEAAGEMYLLDRSIIKLAISKLKQHPELIRIAINLSAQAFKDENLVPIILENLKASGVNPKRITFELTESASLFNVNATQRIIADLHTLGCSFSVDDFGSGFSSFSYLKDLPADYIKLDGSFIQNLHRDKIDRTLVKAMIQVIQALGKKAVAEYVENEAILDILKSMGVDFVQGYHIGHPLPIEQLFTPPIGQHL